jgi:CRISPR-associated protein Cas2
MQDHGNHTQYSVFLCELDRTELAGLRSQLAAVVHHRDDQLLIIDLGPAHHDLDQAVESLGRPFAPTPRAFIV